MNLLFIEKQVCSGEVLVSEQAKLSGPMHDREHLQSSCCDVLHITQPTREGVGNIVRQLAIQQSSAGHRVGVASPDDVEFTTPLIDAGCKHWMWDSVRSPVRGLWSESRRLLEILRKSRPRLLHVHSAKAGLVTRYTVRGKIPTLFQPNGWSFRAGPRWVRSSAHLFELVAAKHWTDRILCVSQSEADAVAGRVDASKLTVVPNGIDLKRWNGFGYRTDCEAREELGIASGGPLVVAVGRVTRQKGPDLMVQMWPRILAAVPEARLVWAGGGDQLQEFQSRYRGDAKIDFCGPTNNPKRYFQAASVVVMPSRWEGHSLSMLEALATGRPIVAFDVEGMKETIVGSLPQPLGQVVSADDLDGFADAVIATLRMSPSDAKNISHAAISRVEEHFSFEKNCNSIEEIYLEMTARGDRPIT